MSDCFATPWTVAHQVSLSMGFPRKQYCNGLAFPSPVDLPDPGTELESPVLARGYFTTKPPEKLKTKSTEAVVCDVTHSQDNFDAGLSLTTTLVNPEALWYSAIFLMWKLQIQNADTCLKEEIEGRPE